LILDVALLRLHLGKLRRHVAQLVAKQRVLAFALLQLLLRLCEELRMLLIVAV